MCEIQRDASALFASEVSGVKTACSWEPSLPSISDQVAVPFTTGRSVRK